MQIDQIVLKINYSSRKLLDECNRPTEIQNGLGIKTGLLVQKVKKNHTLCVLDCAQILNVKNEKKNSQFWYFFEVFLNTNKSLQLARVN